MGSLCADIYGPSESIIGQYLQGSGDRDKVQVLTKFCCFGRAMQSASSASFVRQVCASLPSPTQPVSSGVLPELDTVPGPYLCPL